MNICIGRWDDTPKAFDPETEDEARVRRLAVKQAKDRPRDPCLGVHDVTSFQALYNNDVLGEYALDPAFYWIRFVDTGAARVERNSALYKTPEDGETGYCVNCVHCGGVDEEKDVCICDIDNPHKDWRYNGNEPCCDWDLD